jgi:phosphocarrier protein
MTYMLSPLTRTFFISNKKGLHARASAKFVQTVNRFNAEVVVTRGEESVAGSSIMGLLTLAAAYKTSIQISVCGPEAQACLEAISYLIESGFFEEL